jgi:poly-gamma-glutamate biosynthesis protein PgsC/CapC
VHSETLLLGFVVSMAFYEMTGVSPGGIVVPGILALYLPEPLRFAGTLAVTAATLAVYRFLEGRMLLFGRRRFFVLVTTAGLLAAASAVAAPALFPSAPDLRAVGLVVPGLLANACQKQGVLKTLSAACVAVAVIALVSRLLELL